MFQLTAPSHYSGIGAGIWIKAGSLQVHTGGGTDNLAFFRLQISQTAKKNTAYLYWIFISHHALQNTLWDLKELSLYNPDPKSGDQDEM